MIPGKKGRKTYVDYSKPMGFPSAPRTSSHHHQINSSMMTYEDVFANWERAFGELSKRVAIIEQFVKDNPLRNKVDELEARLEDVEAKAGW